MELEHLKITQISQLDPLFHTLVVNGVGACQYVDWIMSNSLFSPICHLSARGEFILSINKISEV